MTQNESTKSPQCEYSDPEPVQLEISGFRALKSRTNDIAHVTTDQLIAITCLLFPR